MILWPYVMQNFISIVEIFFHFIFLRRIKALCTTKILQQSGSIFMTSSYFPFHCLPNFQIVTIFALISRSTFRHHLITMQISLHSHNYPTNFQWQNSKLNIKMFVRVCGIIKVNQDNAYTFDCAIASSHNLKRQDLNCASYLMPNEVNLCTSKAFQILILITLCLEYFIRRSLIAETCKKSQSLSVCFSFPKLNWSTFFCFVWCPYPECSPRTKEKISNFADSKAKKYKTRVAICFLIVAIWLYSRCYFCHFWAMPVSGLYELGGSVSKCKQIWFNL